MIATTVLAAQYAGTLDLNDTTRIDARSTVPAPIVSTGPTTQGKDVLSSDFTTTPTARLRLNDRRWDLSLTYSANVTAANVELGLAPQVLNSATASVGWHGRFWRVLLSEAGSYGEFNSSLLYALPTLQAGPGTGMTGTTGTTTTTTNTTTRTSTTPQVPTTVDFGSSSTTGTVIASVGRRATVSVSGGYMTGGGLTLDAKRTFPVQYGPLASVSVGDATSSRDVVTTTAIAQSFTTDGPCAPLPGQAVQIDGPFCVVNAPVGQLVETVRHNLTPTVSLLVSLGVFASVAQALYVREAVIDPSASVTLSDVTTAGGSGSILVTTALAPSIDFRTGLPVNRVQLSAVLTQPVAPGVGLVFTGGLLQSVPVPEPDPYPLTSVNAELDALVHVNRKLDVGVGVQSLWQSQSGYGTLVSNIGFIKATARLPTLRF